jgi:prolipoprotein diacylglyceryltransferase
MDKKQLLRSGITIVLAGFMFFALGYIYLTNSPDASQGRNTMFFMVFTGLLILIVGCRILYKLFRNNL